MAWPNLPMVGVAGAANDPADIERFSTASGIRPDYALVFLNQSSVANLANDTPWILERAARVLAAGTNAILSVPCPGPRQLEAIRDGKHDALYTSIFRQWETYVAASQFADRARWVRLAWEFNFGWQENAAINVKGDWDGPLYVAAFQRIVTLGRKVSQQLRFIWNPNVCTFGIDPLLCYPGKAWVDMIGQDFYMGREADNKPGDWSWFKNEQRGLAWGAALAASEGKYFAVPEWGFTSDDFVPDMQKFTAWLASLPPKLLHHQTWWNREEVMNARLFATRADVYRAAFGQ